MRQHKYGFKKEMCTQLSLSSGDSALVSLGQHNGGPLTVAYHVKNGKWTERITEDGDFAGISIPKG